MIEKIIIQYLTDAGVTAYMEIPKNPSGDYVVVEKTGSSRDNTLSASTVAVQSYSGTLAGAADLNDRIKELILNIDSLDDIGGISLQSDYYFPDVTTKKYRYQAVFDISHY